MPSFREYIAPDEKEDTDLYILLIDIEMKKPLMRRGFWLIKYMMALLDYDTTNTFNIICGTEDGAGFDPSEGFSSVVTGYNSYAVI